MLEKKFDCWLSYCSWAWLDLGFYIVKDILVILMYLGQIRGGYAEYPHLTQPRYGLDN